MICTKFDRNWSAGSEGEDFFFFQFEHKTKLIFPLWPLPSPPGTMMLTFLNLHYIRKLSCNYDLFWLVFLEKKICKWPNPIFAFLWLSPL
jgi:hypothetical protein